MLDEVWRYPVKSMQGERLDAAALDEAGVAGDRGWAVRDVATGTVASAKDARRFGALVTCAAAADGDGDSGGLPTVTVPGGAARTAGDPELDAQLGELLGRSVELADADRCPRRIDRTDPAGDGADFDGADLSDRVSFDIGGGVAGAPRLVDYAAVHLVSRATLAHLADVVGDDGAAVARFRPNLVVDVDVEPFGESVWVGRTLTIGDAALTVVLPTPRCVVPTLALPGHDASPATMRTLAARNRIDVPGFGLEACFGVYAAVDRAATVRRGDRMALLDDAPPETA